jgi:hypothetical protein
MDGIGPQRAAPMKRSILNTSGQAPLQPHVLASHGRSGDRGQSSYDHQVAAASSAVAGSFSGTDFCLIFAPCEGYDEPEILPSSTLPICLMSADGCPSGSITGISKHALDRAIKDPIARADASRCVQHQFCPGRFQLLDRTDRLFVMEPLAGERIDEGASRVALHRIAHEP